MNIKKNYTYLFVRFMSSDALLAFLDRMPNSVQGNMQYDDITDSYVFAVKGYLRVGNAINSNVVRFYTTACDYGNIVMIDDSIGYNIGYIKHMFKVPHNNLFDEVNRTILLTQKMFEMLKRHSEN